MNTKLPKFTEKLSVRVLPSHLAKLERMAEQEGNDVPSVVRRIIAEHEERLTPNSPRDATRQMYRP